MKASIVGVVIVALGAAAPASAAERQARATYIGPTLVAPPGCLLLPALPNGGACFPVQPGETSVDLRVVDVVNPRPIGVLYAFRLANGDLTPIDEFCDGEQAGIAVPPNARTLVVSLEVLALLACEPNAAVTGSITATFR